ncbi:MAG: ComEC family competence protein [Bacteroidales bacterium]|nr:ComEC family competence protein [Bacteroidales bacterium]
MSKKAGRKRNNDLLFSITFFLLLSSLGFSYSYYHTKNHFSNDIPLESRYAGIVLEKAPATKNNFKYIVQINSAMKNDLKSRVNEKILLYNSDSVSNSILNPGSGIMFRARLYEISTNNNPGEFNYKRFMNLKGIRYQTYVYGNIRSVPDARFSLKTQALKIRFKLLGLFSEHGITDDEFSVLAALTLGEKHYLSNELKDSFATSGAMHVLAVSGLHVGIIYLIIVYFFSPFKRIKKIRLIKVLVIIGLLWGYAFITGLSPSVLRACSMFSFIVIGENLKRRSNIYNTLAVSAFVLMLFNPNIVYEVGFQLSYAAVTSIVFFQPKLAGILKPKNRILKYFWELLCVSIAAQLGTALISMYYFHQFPTYFWLSNFVVIPAAALLLYLTVAFFSFSFIPPIASFIASVLKIFTHWLNHSMGFIETLPCSGITGIWISPQALFLGYMILFSFTAFIIYRNIRSLFLTLGICAILLSISNFRKINTCKRQVILIYNHYSASLFSIIDGRDHFYHTSENELQPFSKSILENASGYYGTKPPVEITMNNCVKNLMLTNNGIVYNNTLIRHSDKPGMNVSAKKTPTITISKERVSIETMVSNHWRIYQHGYQETTEGKNPPGQKQIFEKNKGAIMFLFK